MDTFVKRNASAPPGFFDCEAAGLRWLTAACGVQCAEIIGSDSSSLTLLRLTTVGPDRAAAFAFGGRLARTHDAGAGAFGAPPDGWPGPGFVGPRGSPLPMSYAEHRSWGAFYAAERLAPMMERASSRLDGSVGDDVHEVMERCARGAFDDDDRPSRLHGDLWSGNVMWTPDGVVLIDPAAHGGHRETDLAMLALFGCPFLDSVIEGYQTEHPLSDGWRRRVPLHQLYPLLVHVVLFGSSYAHAVAEAARSALTIDGAGR